MVLKNFSVEYTHELIFDEQHLDLHNDYDFMGFKFSGKKRQFEIEWASNEFSSNQKIKEFILLFEEVSFLKMRERDSEMPFSEDSCLSFLGFNNPEDIDVDSYIDPKYKKDNYHLIFNFQSGLAIRIYAEQVKLLPILA